MHDYSAKHLVELGAKLFDQRKTLDSLWQECADMFYPERAHFTIVRDVGDEFASHLMTSAPVLARRDLAESFSSMLRRDRWFKLRAAREDMEDHSAKLWLDRATDIQFDAMNDRLSMFKRAAKMADNDWATFGQAVIQISLSVDRSRLLYRTWHLKDCAWNESNDGVVNQIHRKWRPTALELVNQFGAAVHTKVRDAVEDKKPGQFREVQCRHIVMPSENPKRKFVSIYLDVENEHIMEVVETDRFEYAVPRWQTSGSQYAHSPAVMVALPDARLIQSITLTLLEAGERYVNPPMLATQNAIRSDVQLFAGGVTWIDSDYDERLGEVLRPVTQDKSAFPVGFEMREQIALALKEAFYLNKITLPPMQGHDMTATEVRERVQEYIRQALPLFEPMEEEYNTAICDSTFELLFANGAFGPLEDMPRSLRGQDVKFQFDTPLQNAEDAERVVKFQEMIGLLEQGAAVDPTLRAQVDFHTAFREAMSGNNVPTDWLFSEDEADKRIKEAEQKMMAQQALAEAGQAAEVMKNAGGMQ